MQIMRFLTLFALILTSLQTLALDSNVTLDRSWGLLVGDRVTATIDLPVSAAELDLKSLPQHEKRYGPWLYLLDHHLGEERLLLYFQLINVPAENRKVGTPVLEIRTQDGGFINVPSVQMQIGSFMEQTADGKEGSVHPRDDIRIKPQPQNQLRWQLWAAVAVLALSTLILLAWHFGLRPRQRLPFAQAMFELNKMRLLGRKDAGVASRSLHHAFNRSAGRVVMNSDMEQLWEKCPWLKPIKMDIKSFYKTSAAHFFSPTPTAQKNFEQILKLTKSCRKRERMA